MLELAIQLVVAGVALGIVFVIVKVAWLQRFRFMVTITKGEPRVTRGKVTADFLADVREICQEQGIASGWIGGVTQGKSIALRFSSNIPYACQQRLRNVWHNP